MRKWKRTDIVKDNRETGRYPFACADTECPKRIMDNAHSLRKIRPFLRLYFFPLLFARLCLVFVVINFFCRLTLFGIRYLFYRAHKCNGQRLDIHTETWRQRKEESKMWNIVSVRRCEPVSRFNRIIMIHYGRSMGICFCFFGYCALDTCVIYRGGQSESTGTVKEEMRDVHCCWIDVTFWFFHLVPYPVAVHFVYLMAVTHS